MVEGREQQLSRLAEELENEHKDCRQGQLNGGRGNMFKVISLAPRESTATVIKYILSEDCSKLLLQGMLLPTNLLLTITTKDIFGLMAVPKIFFIV